jgi:hypothetical protein
VISSKLVNIIDLISIKKRWKTGENAERNPRRMVACGLNRLALEKSGNIAQGSFGLGHENMRNLMHMRHILPNLQFRFDIGFLGVFDQSRAVVEQDFFSADLHK